MTNCYMFQNLEFIEKYVTNIGLVIALDEFTEINGATQILPFSHLSQEVPDTHYFEKNHIKILAKSGHGLLFHGRLWHAGGVNSSGFPRHALTLHFCRSFMRQHFDFANMHSNLKNSSELRENARRLLGYNVRMPKSLDEYYVEPEKRKYKSNQG